MRWRNSALRALVAAAVGAAACGPATRPAPAQRGTAASPGAEVSIVAGGAPYALVVERREVELVAGEQEVVLGELGRPTGPVSVRPLGRARLLGQRALLPAESGYAALLGRDVVVRVDGVETAGRLVAVDDTWLAVEVGAGEGGAAAPAVRTVRVPRARAEIRVAGDAPGLALQDARLALRLDAPAAGRELVEITSVQPITWRAEHELTLAAAPGGPARLRTRVVVESEAGRRVEASRVTLLTEAQVGRAERGIEVPGPVTLAPGATWLALGEPGEVAVEVVTRVDGTAGSLPMMAQHLDAAYGAYPIDGTLRDEVRFACPAGLPAGAVLVRREGAAVDAPALRTTVEAVAPGGVAVVALGEGSGLWARRQRIAANWGSRVLIETFEIVVRNSSSQTRQVRVWEPLYRSPKFEIRGANRPWQAAGERAIEFTLAVEPGKIGHVRYTVAYPF
jgi:hypothetical protein